MINECVKRLLQIFLDNQSSQKALFDLANFVLLSEKTTNFSERSVNFLEKLSWKDLTFGAKIEENTAKKYLNALKCDIFVNKEIKNIKNNNIQITTFFDPKYPKKLKEISHPPFFLFHKGDLISDEFFWNFAVVGARKNSNYGQYVLKNILPDLVRNNAAIVSGGAEGIDSIAHEITIQHKGKTVVVVGSGLGTRYPLKNTKLFQEILESGGCEISIFPFNTPPNKINFPIRNRVIAGLSEGILVVEASTKSGSLITANFGLNENRDIFAIPGPINSQQSSGCNLLLKKGAILTENTKDILDVYSTRKDLKKYFKEAHCQPDTQKNENINMENIFNEKKINECKQQKTLLSLLKNAKNMDELILETRFSEEYLLDTLFELELQNLIKQDFAGKWNLI